MRILLVEDEPDILELSVIALRQLGNHEVTTATSGGQALIRIEQASVPFDVLLLDIQMPSMSGIDLCREVRAISAYAHVPIIMTTAMTEKHYIDGAFAAGATDYLTKPFDFLELKHRIAVAEKYAFQTAELARSVQSVRMARDSIQLRKLHKISDPLPIDDVPRVIRMHALESYLKQLTKISLSRTRFFAVSVSNIFWIYDRCSDHEFCDQITDIAEAISDSFHGWDTTLISYFGGGVYGVATDHASVESTQELLYRIDEALHALGPVYQNGESVEVSFDAIEILKPAIFSKVGTDEFVDHLFASLRTSAEKIAVLA